MMLDGYCSEWQLDEGEVPNAEIRVLQTIRSTGEAVYHIRHKGYVPLSQFIGLLELAKTRIIREFEDG